MTIDEAEVKQNKFAEKIDNLRAYPARGSKYIDLKERGSKWIDLKKLWWMGKNC